MRSTQSPFDRLRYPTWVASFALIGSFSLGLDCRAQAPQNDALTAETEMIEQAQVQVAPLDIGLPISGDDRDVPFVEYVADSATASQIPEPWWVSKVSNAMRSDSSLPIDLDTLFALTIVHSGRVKAFAQTPWINQMQLAQARAAFDPTFYSDNRFDSISDPVGNTLTTGGPDRLREDAFSSDSGFRGTRTNGTTYRVGQRFGHKNSNSTFFIPNNQGTSRLFANLTKPLLRGQRTDVNRTLVITAQFDTQVARAAYQKAAQKRLFDVADKYWSLYVERASQLQRERHLSGAKNIAELLESRAEHDGVWSQVLRARAAVANREAELVQVESRIRNMESSLRALVNAPELVENRQAEFLPMQAALINPVEFNIEDEVAIGLMHRPEVAELNGKASILKARLRLARDQTQPTLNLVTEGYVAGLEGNSNIGRAFTEQFSEGRPGYAAGLVYEAPVGRRAATATVRQRQIELLQLNHLLRETTETIRAEVESAIRDLGAAKYAAKGRHASLAATKEEVEYLEDRWRNLGNDPRLGQLQLNDLLSSQDRLLQEERSLLEALVEYNRAILEVQRATGQLIQFAQ